jgi:hypothetical protein
MEQQRLSVREHSTFNNKLYRGGYAPARTEDDFTRWGVSFRYGKGCHKKNYLFQTNKQPIVKNKEVACFLMALSFNSPNLKYFPRVSLSSLPAESYCRHT